MEVYEKINYLIQEKNIKKVDFVKKIIDLQPIIKSSGLVPTEQTIYRYLNGNRELKIELLPYVAEVLEVEIQELFEYDIEYATNYNIKHSRQIKQILDLLPYAPKITIEKLTNQLLQFKQLHENFKI